jgi:ubiquinone/menaquinone biosynthesis C-methylase UbiE
MKLGNSESKRILNENSRSFWGSWISGAMEIANSKIQSFSKQYWAGKTDGAHRHPTEESFQKYALELLEILPRRGTLLDIGCGSCQVTTYLAPEFERVYAVDFSETMLTAARQRVQSLGLTNVTVLSGSAQRFPVDVTSADVILTSAVIQYMSHGDLRLHLKECRRILRRGGVVLAALVPDAARKTTYYYGYFLGDRFHRLRLLRSWVHLTYLRANAHLHKDLLWDGIGNWFYQADFGTDAIQAGFQAEFRDAQTSEYRFHALLRPSPASFDVRRSSS